jgi:hypothetical protein
MYVGGQKTVWKECESYMSRSRPTVYISCTMYRICSHFQINECPGVIDPQMRNMRCIGTCIWHEQIDTVTPAINNDDTAKSQTLECSLAIPKKVRTIHNM